MNSRPMREASDVGRFPVRRELPGPRSAERAFRQVLRRRLWIVAAVAAGAIVAFGVMARLPVLYASEALLVPSGEQAVLVPGRQVFADLRHDSDWTESERFLLRSSGIANEVILRLGFDAHWPEGLGDCPAAAEQPAPPPLDRGAQRNQQIDSLLSCIDASVIHRTSVVSIRVRAPDPINAAAIANAFAQAYLDFSAAEKLRVLAGADDALIRGIDRLRRELNHAEGRLEAYRRSSGLYKVQGSWIAMQQLRQLNSELSRAEAARAGAHAVLAEARRAIAEGRSDSVPQVLRSGTVQGLTEQQARTDRRLAGNAAVYGSLAPQAKGASAAAAASQSHRAASRMAELEGLVREAHAADARAAALAGQLAELTNRASASADQAIELMALEREAAAVRLRLDEALRRAGETTQVGLALAADVRLISPAVPAVAPSYPPKALFMALSGLVAGLLAGLVILLIEGADDTFRHPDEVEQLTGLPVLCLAPQLRRLALRRELGCRRPSSYSDAIKRLSLRIGTGAAQVVLVTSSVAAEGTSTIATSLGHSLALSGKRVLLVDCRGRGRRPAAVIGLAGDAGLADGLNGAETIMQAAIARDPDSGLHVLPMGVATTRSRQLMTGAAMAALLRRLAERFDLVLLDGGPVLVAAETLALSRMADEVVYVVRWGKASHRMVLAGLGQLRTVQARVAGIVVSRIVVSRLRSHGFHAFRPARRSVRWPEGSLPSGASALLARVTTLWRGRSQNHSVILPLSRSSAASGGKNG